MVICFPPGSVNTKVHWFDVVRSRLFWPPEMCDHQQWTAVFVGSLAARMTMTGDGGGWNRRRAGCSRKDTMAPDSAGISK